MPSLITHLRIGQNVNKTMNLPKEEFYLGNLLPDIVKNENHKITHYSCNRIPIVNEYLNELNDTKLSAVELGYLCHLLTDKFYNEFIFKNYIKLDNNSLIRIKINEKYVNQDEETINKLKHSVYENYDSFILINNLIEPFVSTSFIKKIEMPRINTFSFDKDYLKEKVQELNYKIENTDKNHINNYVFSSQDELDKVFLDCCNYILEFISNHCISIKKGDF